MSKESVIQKIRGDVERYGWHCLSVHPREGDEGPHFTYTIGLQASYGHPEIMIFDLGSEVSHRILTDCVELIKSGTRFVPGVEYTEVVGGGYKVVFRVVREEAISTYFGSAVRFYDGKPFSGLIMFWPNKEHQFPWQVAEPQSQKEALGVVI